MLNRLTKLQVAHAKPGRYCDGGGLWLQVRKTGSKSWLYRYRTHWMGLGSAETVSLAEARERARLERIRRLDGVDPLHYRRERLAEQRRERARAKTCRDA